MEVAIDCTHCIGDPKKKRKKACPINVKFVRYYDWKEVFSKKKHLMGKGTSITESLRSFRMNELTEAWEKHGFNHAWLINGSIMFKNENYKPTVYYS